MKNKKSLTLIIIIILTLGLVYWTQLKMPGSTDPQSMDPPQSGSIGYDVEDRELIFGDASDEEIDRALDLLSKEYWKRAEVEEEPKITEEDIKDLHLEDIINSDHLDKLSFQLQREPISNE